jgi:hypothetical protein
MSANTLSRIGEKFLEWSDEDPSVEVRPLRKMAIVQPRLTDDRKFWRAFRSTSSPTLSLVVSTLTEA